MNGEDCSGTGDDAGSPEELRLAERREGDPHDGQGQIVDRAGHHASPNVNSGAAIAMMANTDINRLASSRASSVWP